jgi:hypothetical protein
LKRVLMFLHMAVGTSSIRTFATWRSMPFSHGNREIQSSRRG